MGSVEVVLRRILFDVEGDGLLPELTKLHCICTVDVNTGEVRDFGPNELQAAVEYLATADILIAHFGIGYDFPALAKVLRFDVPVGKQRDTVVISRVKFPNIKETDSRWNAARVKEGQPTMGLLTGKHSLEAWGIRLKIAKLHTDIEDWSVWTPQIQERCQGDVQTNLKLWKLLNPDAMPQDVLDLEHRVQRLTQMITAAGWPFDVKKAGELHATLLDEKFKAEKKLVEEFGGWWAPKNNKQPFTPKKDDKKRGYVKGQPCTQIEWITFNPGSHKHIERSLKKLGWAPTEFTDNGNPTLDEEQLDNIVTEFPQASGITRYLMLTKRLGQLAEGKQAWLKHVKADGRVHTSYNPMGTVTSRMTHYDFNISQVPAASAEYGHECRELFRVPEGWELVGADMQSLEGRCLAHYLAKYDGGDYGRVLLEGDPHWAVVKAMGFLDCARDTDNQLHTIVRETGAKRGFYAMLYGAGAEKVGRIILDTCRLALKTNPEWGFLLKKFFGEWGEAPSKKKLQLVGGQAKRDVIEGIPGFSELMKFIQNVLLDQEACGKPMALPGIDGRRLPIRSEHSALNALLQSCGAILCKRWNVDAYDALIAAGFKWGWDGDFVIVGIIHDEKQIACRKGLADRIGLIVVKAAQETGKPYGFRIRLDSSFKTGSSWAQTH